MKLELFIGIIVILLIANIYYEGKIMTFFKSYKKYYKMGIIAFIGLCLYLYIKKYPYNTKDLLNNANSYIKYIPIDNSTKSFISPIIDFTNKSISDSITSSNGNIYNNNYSRYNNLMHQQLNLLKKSKTTKRSVSETKKKYVASSQNWLCKHCKKMLPAWFEVDHVEKLEHGGSNDITNLEALCRDCHGKKTALENL